METISTWRNDLYGVYASTEMTGNDPHRVGEKPLVSSPVQPDSLFHLGHVCARRLGSP
jgi:hypothetical protein